MSIIVRCCATQRSPIWASLFWVMVTSLGLCLATDLHNNWISRSSGFPPGIGEKIADLCNMFAPAMNEKAGWKKPR